MINRIAMKIYIPIKSLFLFVIFFIAAINVSAQITWDGEAGTDSWHDANNWNPNSVPTSTDDVQIPAGNTVIVDGADAQAASVTFGSENNNQTTLQVNAGYTLTVSGDIGLASAHRYNNTDAQIIGSGSG